VLSGVAWIGFLVELMGFLSLFGNYFPYVWSVIKAFGTRFGHETPLLALLTLCIAAFLCWCLVAMHCRQVVEVLEVVQARKQDDPVCAQIIKAFHWR
jgi:hypothetical protein